jgi:hypothetical protein
MNHPIPIENQYPLAATSQASIPNQRLYKKEKRREVHRLRTPFIFIKEASNSLMVPVPDI